VGGPASEIKIESMDPRHFRPILKIERSVFKDPWTAASFLEVMSFSPNNWVAILDGQLVGYVVTQWVLDEIHILNVAVAPNTQRQGVGSKLLRHVIAEGQQHAMRDMFLEVRIGNSGAITLYERFGFKMLTVRKKYYTDGEDALVMHCSVPERASVPGTSLDAAGSKTEET